MSATLLLQLFLSHLFLPQLLLPQLLLLAPPPVELSQTPQQALAHVIDDQPLTGDAGLDSLIKEATGWSDQRNFPAPDLAAIAASPTTFRGQTFHLTTGPATRVATSAFDIAHLSAWQTTSPTISEPILLLIYEPDPTAAPGDQVASIDLPARFYRTAIATTHRAGAPLMMSEDDPSQPSQPTQRILIFVGAQPIYTLAVRNEWSAWTGLVIALGVGGVLLWITRHYARRQAAPHLHPSAESAESWNDASLPDEPAEALAELRRRSDDTPPR